MRPTVARVREAAGVRPRDRDDTGQNVCVSDLSSGSEFAGCRIESVLGRGGMGVVYRARDLSLERPVAIKLINDDQAGDAEAHRRFEREARLMAAIDHPNVIPVYAAGEERGHLYLVMRYVDGTDLQALLRAQGRLTASRAAAITDQVGRALDAAHARGLVHRDIKPANVLLSGEHAYLTDFGITRLVDERTRSTDAGKWVGTIDYMSPEQLRGEAVGPLSDVYSLGCLLYACLAGTPPFRRETTPATITAHLHDEPPPASELPGVPKQFDAVIARAVSKRPEDRYQSAGELGAAALSAARGIGDTVSDSDPLARSDAPLWAGAAPGAQAAPQAQPQPPEDATEATVARGEEETRLARTAMMPVDLEATSRAPGAAAARADHARKRRRRRPFALVALAAALVAAVAVVVLVLSDSGSAPPSGPLSAGQITAAVHRFATDYGNRDLGALSRLLAPNVTRVDPTSVQRGRIAVLDEYRQQFTSKPVPTRYAIGQLSVTPGWAGRAQAGYTLTVAGGGTLAGEVVFGLQRAVDGRVQIALISTR